MHLNLHPGAPQFLQSFGLWRTSDISRGWEAMEEAMLARPEAAASFFALQQGTGDRKLEAYDGPENRQGTIAPLFFFLDPCLWGQSIQAHQGDA